MTRRPSARDVHDRLRAWDADPGEPAPWVVSTSGSTGEPRHVLLSRRAMRASADATHERLGGPGQWLLALAPSYVAGLQVLFRSVRAGTPPVLLDEHQDLAAAMAQMSGHRRYLSLVPTQLHRHLDSAPSVVALSSFDAVLVGGAALDPQLRDTAQQRGIRVVSTYGMTETCGGCVYDGVALDGVGVALSDDGRIRLSGPVLFDGYDADPEATAGVLRDGWFLTSDVGRLGEDGRLQVVGRVDDVVVSGGVNVPSEAVATRLRQHPAVSDAAVVGVPDPAWGQQVVAVLRVAETAPDLDSLRDFVSSKLPRSWAPRRLLLVDALPLLANGKVDRLAVEALASRP